LADVLERLEDGTPKLPFKIKITLHSIIENHVNAIPIHVSRFNKFWRLCHSNGSIGSNGSLANALDQLAGSSSSMDQPF
jgi:hypothetical protein